ncbi:Uma2 family endonuclease [Singulisphaera rosea]
MLPTRPTVSADDLWRMPRANVRRELLRGELRIRPLLGAEHGAINARVAMTLGHHVGRSKLGVVFGAGTGFKTATNPDTVLAPDVAFVRQVRIPASGIPRTYWPGAPDLVVEVVSPEDTAEDVDGRATEWVSAGVKVVWVVKPKRRTVAVHHERIAVVNLSVDDEIAGGEVIPGFRCPVTDFFPD